jgi:hypothetical protein
MKHRQHRAAECAVRRPDGGVTDRPFRMLCRSLGAGYAVSEMVTSKAELWDAEDLAPRRPPRRAGPIAVQIAGVDPAEMAAAARHNIDRGAQIIDINMGCPAKKVCNQVGRLGADAGRAAGAAPSSRPWSPPARPAACR